MQIEKCTCMIELKLNVGAYKLCNEKLTKIIYPPKLSIYICGP